MKCKDLMAQLAEQSPLYQPSVFWQEASKDRITQRHQQRIVGDQFELVWVKRKRVLG
jgi:hypothetical protein